ncbi:hypothetical protein [Pseudomonas sp. GD03944]|uniref:hypothetical protein n=1 Tax=Pseudomonas sp. GD03944 TaxID=2975409 RepID=UPI002447DF77|nr:hypothetical protein [Pseudomonas sp. GD03944]MDH1261843.1 hypothetical protein [Pseudomonas sp. GD03944]
MNDGSNLILFLATQLLLPADLGYAYCRSKGSATQSSQAGGMAMGFLARRFENPGK